MDLAALAPDVQRDVASYLVHMMGRRRARVAYAADPKVGSALLKRVADVSRRKDSVRAHAGEKVAALRRVGAST